MTVAVDLAGYFEDEGLDTTAVAHALSFLRHLSVERGLSQNTVRAYAIDLRTYLSWAARSKVEPLSVDHRRFRHYLACLNASGYEAKTVARRLSAVRSYFKYLNVLGVVDANPAAAAASPKLPRDLPRKTAASDVEKLLSTCDLNEATGLRDQAFLELLYATGARIAEVAALKVSDVDFALGQVRLFGKGSKERIVPLHRLALDTLARYISEARPQLATKGGIEELFVSTRGNAMSADALRRVFKQRAKQAGLDPFLHPHDLRHAFATDLVEGGADLRSVQEMLGHASLSTTQIYTHLSLEHMKNTYRQAHPRS